MKNKTENRGGLRNPPGGRPKTDRRKVNRKRPYYVYEDQSHLTGEQVRQAIDEWMQRNNQ